MTTPDTELYRAWKAWDAAGFARLSAEDDRYFALELKTAGVTNATRSVLEVGFGNGGFAAFARERGWQYTGTEIDPALVARAREAGLDVHEAPEDLATHLGDARFDLIVAFDVLEHLTATELATMLAAWRDLLTPDGRAIARFPSGDSPFSGAMQHGDITHQSRIGSGMVHQLCLAAGLEPVQIRAPVLPVRGLGGMRGLRRAMVVAARWPVRGFLRAAFYDNRPAVIDPNMLIVLRRQRD